MDTDCHPNATQENVCKYCCRGVSRWLQAAPTALCSGQTKSEN